MLSIITSYFPWIFVAGQRKSQESINNKVALGLVRIWYAHRRTKKPRMAGWYRLSRGQIILMLTLSILILNNNGHCTWVTKRDEVMLSHDLRSNGRQSSPTRPNSSTPPLMILSVTTEILRLFVLHKSPGAFPTLKGDLDLGQRWRLEQSRFNFLTGTLPPRLDRSKVAQQNDFFQS